MDAFPECEHIGLAIWYTQIYAILSFGVVAWILDGCRAEPGRPKAGAICIFVGGPTRSPLVMEVGGVNAEKQCELVERGGRGAPATNGGGFTSVTAGGG